VSVSLFRRTIVVLLHAQEEAMSFYISRVVTRPVYVSALLSDKHVYLQTTINEQLDCKTFHQRAKVYWRSQHE